MSVFFRSEQRSSDPWFPWQGTGSNAHVSESQATHLAPVFAALRHIVDFGSTLPIDAYRADGGKRTPIPPPPLVIRQNLLGMPGFGTWIGQGLYGLAAHGNAVAWVLDGDINGVTDARWLGRGDWSCSDHTGKWSVFGQEAPSSRILHVPWIVPPGATLGLSPIEHFASIVKAGLSAQDYADVRRGGGVPPTHLKNTRKTLNPTQSDTIRDRAAAAFATGKPFVSGADWDLKLMTIPPNHAQFIETLKLSASAIASIYGIDPREIGGDAANGSITYTNDESRSLNRAQDMRPYLVRFERAISKQMARGDYVKFNIDATIRADIKTRTEVTGAQVADGRLSVNEARELEDRAPVQGGDYHNVPAPTASPVSREGAPS